MTNPYEVPVEELDAVHVSGEELLTAQEPVLRWADGGGPSSSFGEGAQAGGGGADGE